MNITELEFYIIISIFAFPIYWFGLHNENKNNNIYKEKLIKKNREIRDRFVRLRR